MIAMFWNAVEAMVMFGKMAVAICVIVGLPVLIAMAIRIDRENEALDPVAYNQQEPGGCGALLLVIIAIVLASMMGGAF